MMLADDRWRVLRANCKVDWQTWLVQELEDESQIVRLFCCRQFTIVAMLDRDEDKPTLPFVAPRLYVTHAEGSGHVYKLPLLTVKPGGGIEGVDYISNPVWNWSLREQRPQYLEDEDRWITTIQLYGSWNAWLPRGTFTVPAVV